MRSQRVAFTERNAVLNKIHEALAVVTFHSDQTEILEEIVEKSKESFDGASSGSETAAIMAVPQVNCRQREQGSNVNILCWQRRPQSPSVQCHDGLRPCNALCSALRKLCSKRPHNLAVARDNRWRSRRLSAVAESHTIDHSANPPVRQKLGCSSAAAPLILDSLVTSTPWRNKSRGECDSSDTCASAVKCHCQALHRLVDPSSGSACRRRDSRQ